MRLRRLLATALAFGLIAPTLIVPIHSWHSHAPFSTHPGDGPGKDRGTHDDHCVACVSGAGILLTPPDAVTFTPEQLQTTWIAIAAETCGLRDLPAPCARGPPTDLPLA